MTIKRDLYGTGQEFTNGAAHVSLDDSEAIFAKRYDTVETFGGTADDEWTTGDLSLYDKVTIRVEDLVDDTLEFRCDLAGSGSANADATYCVRHTDGTTVAATALGNGTYTFNVNGRYLIAVRTQGGGSDDDFLATVYAFQAGA